MFPFLSERARILGIAGLAGAGRSELLETIFGIAKKSGTVTVHGRRADNRSSRQAIQNGFALLTEERRATEFSGFWILSQTPRYQISRITEAAGYF